MDNPHEQPKQSPATLTKLVKNTPQKTITLALPTPTNTVREDIWSQSATAILIQAWGDKHTTIKNLNQNHWNEVANTVNIRDRFSKTPKTHSQCKNRIETVKKRYKMEKSRVISGGSFQWMFYHTIDRLIGKEDRDKHLPVRVSDLEPTRGLKEDNWGKSVRELSRAVLRFGEAYQKSERLKMEQVAEMEKRRMEFAKEIEMQRMEFLRNAQLQISKFKRRKIINNNTD